MKISLILHLYKNTKYLEKCIKSIFDQTDKNFELIAFSDGIKQEVKDVVKKFNLDELKNKNIKVIHTNANFGHSVSYNYGAKQATGEYVYYFGSNVILKPDFISSLNDLIDKHSNADIISFNTIKPKAKEDEIELLKTIADDFTKGPFNSTNDKIIKRSYLLDNKIEFKSFKHYPLQFYIQLAMHKPKWYLYIKQLAEIMPSSSFTYNIFDLHEQTIDVVERILETGTYEHQHKNEIEFLVVVTLLSRFLKNLFIIKPSDSSIQKIAIAKAMNVLESNFSNWKKNKYLVDKNCQLNSKLRNYFINFKPYPFYIKHAIKKGYFKNNEK